ncbi:hypothetical protein [Mycoplasma mycoides]|uniref:hypothetical protein n=1 Tax=Mycoplasma mycoides TaxID=2102 RepID=UPI001E5DBE31|nr:hypothetical protein [Mycoplasma mycoides]
MEKEIDNLKQTTTKNKETLKDLIKEDNQLENKFNKLNILRDELKTKIEIFKLSIKKAILNAIFIFNDILIYF